MKNQENLNSQGKGKSTDDLIIQMLELSNEDCKEPIITMLHEVRENTLEINEKPQQRNRRHKVEQNTIVELKYSIT